MTRVQIKGLPKSGTTALTDYIREHTGLDTRHQDKHQPHQVTNAPVVHIMKHPCSWIVSQADWVHTAATRDELESWMWVKMRLYEWAALAEKHHAQARVTVTHHDLITDLLGTLTRICEAVQAGYKAPPAGRSLKLSSRRKGSPTNKGPFDPAPYLDREYLDAYPPGIQDELWSHISGPWGTALRDRIDADPEWWTRMATPKPKQPPTTG